MTHSDVFGSLQAEPAATRPDLLAAPVRAAIQQIPEALVAEIDPAYADTENLCAQYGVPMDASANAVIVRGTRAGVDSHVCCMTLAHRRIDVNGLVRRRLNARKASFAPMDFAAFYRLACANYLHFVDAPTVVYPNPTEHCDVCRWWQR